MSFPFYSTLCLSSLSYLIISLVPTCLVHNCKTSQELLYFHLLSLLFRDQIPLDPHHCFLLEYSFVFPYYTLDAAL